MSQVLPLPMLNTTPTEPTPSDAEPTPSSTSQKNRSLTVGSRPSTILNHSSNDPTTKPKPETPRTALANKSFTAKPSEVESMFQKYRALVPNCVVNKYIQEAQDKISNNNKTPLKISAYAESYWGAVLFADISGFSKLAEKLQQELGEGAKAAETLSRYVGKSLDVRIKATQ